MKLLRSTDYQVMPWKNGQGITSQIKIFPESASTEKQDFTWRISLAQVSQSGQFSLFDEYQRKLILLSGNGLRLNGRALFSFQPITFDGAEKIEFELIDGEVSDLGVIYRADLVRVEMKLLVIQNRVDLDEGEHFFFAGDACQLNEILLNAGECLYVASPLSLRIRAEESARIILVSVHKLL